MSLIVCSQNQVEAVLSLQRPTHVVSLISPDALAPQLGLPAERHLVLRFNDINAPQTGLTAPDQSMVADLIAFSDLCRPPSPLLLHCYAGVSRSPAAAYVIACWRAGPGQEASLAETLRRRSPTATPNPWLIALADAWLGRGGAMIEAITRLGRGANAFEGETFSLS